MILMEVGLSFRSPLIALSYIRNPIQRVCSLTETSAVYSSVNTLYHCRKTSWSDFLLRCHRKMYRLRKVKLTPSVLRMLTLDCFPCIQYPSTPTTPASPLRHLVRICHTTTLEYNPDIKGLTEIMFLVWCSTRRPPCVSWEPLSAIRDFPNQAWGTRSLNANSNLEA